MSAPSPVTQMTEAEAFDGYRRSFNRFNAAPSERWATDLHIAYRRYLWTVEGADEAFVAGCMERLKRAIADRMAGGREVDGLQLANEAADEETRHLRGVTAALDDRIANLTREDGS